MDGAGGKVQLVRYGVFVLGLAVIAYGCVLMIVADLGVAPWDVFHIGLQKTFGLTIGIWSQIFGAFVIILSYLLARIKPGIGTVLNMILFGLFVDLFMWLDAVPHAEGWVFRLLQFAVGLLLMGIGIGMYIAPRLGAGPRDSFMLALNERMGWSIQNVRMGIEITVLVAGAFLGGPVSFGTLLTAVLTGPLVQRSIPFWERQMDRWIGTGAKEQLHA